MPSRPSYRLTPEYGRTSYSFEASPQVEAKALLPLLRLPGECIESVRALIAVSEVEEKELRRNERCASTIVNFRRKVLDHFDVLVGLKAMPPPPIKPPRVFHRKFDDAAIAEALRSGQESSRAIAAKFKCSRNTVFSIGRRNNIKIRRHTSRHREGIADAQSRHVATCAD
jgi:hypothetical protein